MPRTRMYLLLMLSIPLAAAAPRATAPDAVFSGYETRVTTDLGDQYDPSIAGDIVVFTDYRSTDSDVYSVDLTTMAEHPVIVAPGNQQLTGTSGGRVVYTDYRSVDVVLFNASDGTTTNLTRPDKDALGRNFNSVDPAISGDLVAWQDSRDGNMEIYAMNVATSEERRITNSPDIDQRPSVGGTLIAWERCAQGGTCDIWSYDWSSGTTTQVTNTPASNERTPNIDGTRIVYQGDRSGNNDIYLFDLTTGVERHLPLAGDQANPHVSGDNVSMDDLSQGLYHIKLWHLPTDEVFQITSGTSGQYLSDIDGNRVVYTDDRNGDLDIYMFTFKIELPSTDTTPPAIAITPPCPATLTLNAPFTVDVAVTDDGSGVKTQTVPNGPLALDTSAVGTHVLTIDAVDNAGNPGSDSCTYGVIYDFAGGFLPPIAHQPAVNSARAGSAVPVKFQIPNGHGGYVSDLAAITAITFGQVADFGAAPDTEIDAPTAGASGLRYDAIAQQFVFTWKTDKTMAGRSYMLVLHLADGMEYYANFKLK